MWKWYVKRIEEGAGKLKNGVSLAALLNRIVSRAPGRTNLMGRRQSQNSSKYSARRSRMKKLGNSDERSRIDK